MKQRILKLLMMVFAITALMASTAFGAGWTLGQGENSSRWWYDLDNGQYYKTADQTVEWQWLDGNGDGIAECYAFDSQGWMYAGTTTPDGYTVNADGAWTVNGTVQSVSVAAGYAGTRAQTDAKTGTESTAEAETDGNRRILVAYFSQTGNTEEAAREIQAVAGGDLFEITVVDAYPDSYQATVDRAREELDEGARPALSSSVSNMDDYDVILLGYPIWWHTEPMAVNTFLESYDLTGKTILPFCTSGGSNISESMPDIRETAGARGASVGTGLTANSLSESIIRNWLSNNGVR